MTAKTAIKLLLGLFIVVILFHFCILLQIIPYEITWGGRLKSVSEMYVFESISITINFLIMAILLMKGGYIKRLIPLKVINIILWVFVVLFALNTVGNLLAKTNFEKFFAVLTLLSAVLLWIVLRKKTTEIGN